MHVKELHTHAFGKEPTHIPIFMNEDRKLQNETFISEKASSSENYAMGKMIYVQ